MAAGRLISGTLGLMVLAHGAALAGAGAALTGATPSADSVAEGAPTVVVLDFNTAVATKSCRISVSDSTGRRVDSDDLHTVGDDHHLAVSLKTVMPGRYVVKWHVTGVDAARASGSYSFTVAQ